MRAQRVLETLADWIREPGLVTYQCQSCGAAFETPESECPDCGGEVDELLLDPNPPYVGPLG